MTGTWVTSEQAIVDGGYVSFAGMRLHSILSAELFSEIVSLEDDRNAGSRLAAACHDRWTDLADTLAALPQMLEGYLVVGQTPNPAGSNELLVCFLAVGRGSTAMKAKKVCEGEAASLWDISTTTLDYAQLKPLSEDELLAAISFLGLDNTFEIGRRLDGVSLANGSVTRRSIGFDRQVEPDIEKINVCEVRQLFPWIPSSDPWRRLLEALLRERDSTAFVVHFATHCETSESCVGEAGQMLIEAERIVSMNVDSLVKSVHLHQTETLRPEAFRRLAILEGKTLEMHLFLTSNGTISPSLQSIAATSIHDSSVYQWQHGFETMFKGGAVFSEVQPGAVSRPLGKPTFEFMFGPREAGAILRTPMPMNQDFPGLSVMRFRTAAMTGQAGDDCYLGTNIHRGSRNPVAMDADMRFRHTYVIGQTGTGKSTLLLNSIMQDIRAGRGVGVLDPHGSLIEDVLLRFPEERADDLVLVDVADTERPIPFNILRIKERDPKKYRLIRDLIIDDLFAFFNRTYERDTMGPMFETHIRGFMSLLLGLEPQIEPLIPNLLVFRSLYQNADLRNTLVDRIRDHDILVEELIKEAVAVKYDGALENLAPYITSKFNRFVSDGSLRNITCQNDCLDIDDVVNNGKVLLFYLGKGKFGDQAAGLLASQVVSRVRSAVMKRGTDKNIRPFYLYADEFQLFADQRFAELLAEARKFRLSLTLAHQFTKQIPEEILDAVLGNVGTTVVFRIGAPDAAALAPYLAPNFNERDVISLPNFNAYVKSFGRLGETPFSMETPAASSDIDLPCAERLRELSRQRFGRPRAEVEQEIRNTVEAYRGIGKWEVEEEWTEA